MGWLRGFEPPASGTTNKKLIQNYLEVFAIYKFYINNIIYIKKQKNKNKNNEKINSSIESLNKVIKFLTKDLEKTINLLEKIPNIKDDDYYAFALACLKKNNEQALEIFNKNKQNKISVEEAKSWYIFKRFYKNKKFKEIFKKKSGYPFKLNK